MGHECENVICESWGFLIRVIDGTVVWESCRGVG